MYKIIFMGTPDFAVETLKQIYNSENELLFCVSQPDKPKGRNMQLQPTPVKEFCVQNNIKILQPEKIRKNEDFINEIKKAEPDIIVVVAYGRILPKAILEIPKLGCINVHGSLLPQYRGSAPIQWSVINGDLKTGITTMYMDEGMDTGDMLLKGEIDIGPDDTFGIVYDKLKILGGELLIKTLKDLPSIKPQKQIGDFTIAPMIEKELGHLDFNKSALELHNLIRGLNPMPGAYFYINEKKYKVWETKVLNDGNDSPDDSTDLSSKKEPGTVLRANSKEGLHIQTGNGILSITVIQAENSKRMNICDYLRGNNIEENIVI